MLNNISFVLLFFLNSKPASAHDKHSIAWVTAGLWETKCQELVIREILIRMMALLLLLLLLFSYCQFLSIQSAGLVFKVFHIVCRCTVLQVHCLYLSNHMHAGHVCIVSYSSVSAHILCQVQVGSSLCCCVALNILSLCCSAYCVCQVHTLEACVSLCHWHIFHSPRCRCSPRCPKSLYNVFLLEGQTALASKQITSQHQ